MLKETIIVTIIVFGILAISWFYFSWKIEKEQKESRDKKDDSQKSDDE